MRIVVVCGGDSSEREVSLSSGEAVAQSLKLFYKDVICLKCKSSQQCIKDIIELKPDVVFIALHGGFGENGQLQATLELYGIRHTGCSFNACSLAMDKFVSKSIFKARGIPSPEGVLVRKMEDIRDVSFFPVCVKPTSEGSSIGVEFAKDMEELESIARKLLEKYKGIVVEKKLEGKELTVAVLFGEALPVIHIKPLKGFYDYRNKYTKGATEYIVPADIDKSTERLVKEVAVEAYNAIGCDSYARIDMILEGNVPYVLEINSIPGMTETSLLPKAAKAAGISFEELVKMLVEKA